MGAHTGICACYVMFLYSRNFFFVFLDSASVTGGSPISPWQEHAPDLTIFDTIRILMLIKKWLHLARAQANAFLCR